MCSYNTSLNTKGDQKNTLSDVYYFDSLGRPEYFISLGGVLTERSYYYSGNGDTIAIVGDCPDHIFYYYGIQIIGRKTLHLERSNQLGRFSEDIKIRRGKIYEILQYSEPDHRLVQKWKNRRRGNWHYVEDGSKLIRHEKFFRGRMIWAKTFSDREIRTEKHIVHDPDGNVIYSRIYVRHAEHTVDQWNCTVHVVHLPRKIITYISTAWSTWTREVITYDDAGYILSTLIFDEDDKMISGSTYVYKSW